MNPEPHTAPEDEFIRQLTRNQGALRGYILASLGDPNDAQDVLQKANVVLWKKAATWDPNSRFLTWAFAVARFEVLAYIRDRQRDRHLFDPDVVELMTETSIEVLDYQSERHEALADCLKRLKAADRSLLSSHYASGNTLQEIAERIGKKAGAIRVQVMRLRRILADCIDSRLESTSPQ